MTVRRVSPPGDGQVRVRMTVGYDGGPFHGFARNEGVTTVQGEFEAAAERILGHRVSLSCAGRTDKGVHACGQVVSFDAAEARPEIEKPARALNRILNPRIAVFAAELAPDDFDARFSCIGRTYRYRDAELGGDRPAHRPPDVARARSAGELVLTQAHDPDRKGSPIGVCRARP